MWAMVQATINGSVSPSGFAREIGRRVGWHDALSYMAERARRFEQRFRERLGVPGAARTWVRDHGEMVVAGPFAGLRYPFELLAEADAPVAKMIGPYEAPLVGVANAVPGVSVDAIDLASSTRIATRQLAEANAIKSVALHGAATEAHATALAPRTSALFCDIEGAEVDVLTSGVAAALADAMVIVEVHEGIRPGALQAILERWGRTHPVTVHDLPAMEEGVGVSDMRTTEQYWVVCDPRGGEVFDNSVHAAAGDRGRS